MKIVFIIIGVVIATMFVIASFVLWQAECSLIIKIMFSLALLVCIMCLGVAVKCGIDGEKKMGKL